MPELFTRHMQRLFRVRCHDGKRAMGAEFRLFLAGRRMIGMMEPMHERKGLSFLRQT